MAYIDHYLEMVYRELATLDISGQKIEVDKLAIVAMPDGAIQLEAKFKRDQTANTQTIRLALPGMDGPITLEIRSDSPCKTGLSFDHLHLKPASQADRNKLVQFLKSYVARLG